MYPKRRKPTGKAYKTSAGQDEQSDSDEGGQSNNKRQKRDDQNELASNSSDTGLNESGEAASGVAANAATLSKAMSIFELTLPYGQAELGAQQEQEDIPMPDFDTQPTDRNGLPGETTSTSLTMVPVACMIASQQELQKIEKVQHQLQQQSLNNQNPVLKIRHYPILKNIFQRLGPRDVFHLMLACKDFKGIIRPPNDCQLAELIINKLMIQPTTKVKKAYCQWCRMPGTECCKCNQFHHTDHLTSASSLRFGSVSSDNEYIAARKRLSKCKDVASIVLDDTAPPRPPRPPRRPTPDTDNAVATEKDGEVSSGGVAKKPTASAVPEEPEQPRKNCEGLTPKGRVCNNPIELKSEGKRCVRCCTWCGLVALDDPLHMETDWKAPPERQKQEEQQEEQQPKFLELSAHPAELGWPSFPSPTIPPVGVQT
ncbi:hypothetical protein DFH27DRAFT_603405 [Peziza echinospora]|nr:hypothetical protein DFH27DRAFT_603405 [Peziza echinospora]